MPFDALLCGDAYRLASHYVVIVCGIDVGMAEHHRNGFYPNARLDGESAPCVPHVGHAHMGEVVSPAPRLYSTCNLVGGHVARDKPRPLDLTEPVHGESRKPARPRRHRRLGLVGDYLPFYALAALANLDLASLQVYVRPFERASLAPAEAERYGADGNRLRPMPPHAAQEFNRLIGFQRLVFVRR